MYYGKLDPSMDERKTNLMHLLYIFIVAAGDALHVSGMFAHRHTRGLHTLRTTTTSAAPTAHRAEYLCY
jgi:hypothetical protein